MRTALPPGRGLLEPHTVDDMLTWQGTGGFSLGASVRIHGSDGAGRERLLRYCARPPFALDRLRIERERAERSEDAGGHQVFYQPARPTPDGRTASGHASSPSAATTSTRPTSKKARPKLRVRKQPSPAVLDVLTGAVEPSGLLPLQIPADMRTIEEQHEDTPHDMRPHIDTEGHAYDFAYGLNWSGVISDERTARYTGPQ